MSSEIECTEFDLALKRVKAGERERSKLCRVFDKALAARQALAAGLHPQSRRVEKKDDPDLDWEDHPEDDDFDDKEPVDNCVYPGEEEFDYRDLHFCPMTQLYYEDYMRRRNEWFDRYFEELYAQRELEQAEKNYFIESYWDAILVHCH